MYGKPHKHGKDRLGSQRQAEVTLGLEGGSGINLAYCGILIYVAQHLRRCS